MRYVTIAAVGAFATVAAAPQFSNPFCAVYSARDTIQAGLECAPGAGVITGIAFASYGTPDTSGGCGAFRRVPACDLAGFVDSVVAACVNRTRCIVTADHSTPDPCEGVVKTIAIEAACAGAPGGQGWTVQPSCATQNGVPPCPLPQAPWPRTWQLNRSTMAQPGNSPGFLDAAAAARFGLVSLDWSIASNVWHPPGTGFNVSTGAATLVEQCRRIKAVDPSTLCFVYRNSELALEWLEPQRAVMVNASTADYFLQYQPGNPDGAAPGSVYVEVAGAPATGARQFLVNWSNPAAFDYFLRESELGPLGVASPFVDGTFLDDSQAVPQEHPDAPRRLGLTPLQLASIQSDTHRFVQTTIETLAAAGKYSWQGFDGNRCGDPDGAAPGPTAANCAAYMAELCDPAWQDVPMTMQHDGSNTTLAAFLIGRGPVAYIGWGWNGGALPPWDPLFDLDVGVPVGGCATADGAVFTRAWSRGRATLDCRAWTASLNFTFA